MRQIRWLLALLLVTIVGSAAACGGENPILPEQTAEVTPTFQEAGGGPDCVHPVGETTCGDIGANGHWSGCPVHTNSDHAEWMYPGTMYNPVHSMVWAAYNCSGGWSPNS